MAAALEAVRLHASLPRAEAVTRSHTAILDCAAAMSWDASAPAPEGAEPAVALAASALLAQPGPRDIGAAYEEILAQGGSPGARRGDRTRLGAFYTPWPLVNHLLDLALEPLLDEVERGAPPDQRDAALLRVRVCDPSCGAGRFLVGAAERIARRVAAARGGRPGPDDERLAHARAEAIRSCVRAVDIDPVAAALCRMNLCLAARLGSDGLGDFEGVVRAADSLLDQAAFDGFARAGAGGLDLVIGNPPFLSQLGGATAHARGRAASLRARFGPAVGGYADCAGAFLLLGLSLVRDGGVVALVQPLSLLAARDARPLRARLCDGASPVAMWLSPKPVFDAGVLTCAPVVRRGASAPRPLALSRGASFERVETAATDAESLLAHETWSHLLADALGAPAVPTHHASIPLGDIAEATADFRDQYYGLDGFLVEDESLGASADRGRFPRLVTTAMVGPGSIAWGERPVRILKRTWLAPRVDLDRLERETSLGAWASSRLTPKVLLATQTRTLEAWVDEDGSCLPMVPLVTVTARNGADLWRIGASLTSALATLVALRRHAGAAMSADAIKLSARDAMRLPALPADADAIDLYRAASRAGDARERRALLRECAAQGCLAFGVAPGAASPVIAWWESRLGAPRRAHAAPISTSSRTR